MSIDKRQHDSTDSEPVDGDATETDPHLRPMISAADIDRSAHPCISIPGSEYHALGLVADRIADTTSGTTRDHHVGKLGERSVDMHFGNEKRVDTEVRTDGGDGGVDLWWNGKSIQVKTVGRHRRNPALTVDAYRPLRADYYVLVNRVGKTAFRLVGYAPRHFVANTEPQLHNGEPYHMVDQEYLFPITRI